MKKLYQSLAIICVVGMAVLATGCNTTRGFGQDVQAGGKAIQGASNKASS